MADENINLHGIPDANFFDDLFEQNKPNVDDWRSWVVNDESHTTYKAWKAILKLKDEKQANISKCGKIDMNKIPKALYQINKEEVAKIVSKTAQNIFRTSKFSPSVLEFFNGINKELLASLEFAQTEQEKRNQTGLRPKKKTEIIASHQDIERQLVACKSRLVDEVLNLSVSKMPLDLRKALNL
ncbi:hypothetical protein ACBZ91_18665 [Vibrio natriegens]|uniref:hypothetical protein n=1 Tax=Vibrio natriegens TaxID=691 RepID=UPI003557110B